MEDIYEVDEFEMTQQEIMYMSMARSQTERDAENQRFFVITSIGAVLGFLTGLINASLIMLSEHIVTSELCQEILNGVGKNIGTTGLLLMLGSMLYGAAQEMK